MNHIPPFSTITNNEHNQKISNLLYTNQDYASLKARLIEILQQKFTQDFTEINESSLATMLIEMWSYIADQLSFKIDQIANEMFIDTVTERANILRLANLVGFKPTPPTAAKAMFSLNTNQVFASDMLINTPLIVTFQPVNGVGESHMELFASDENGNSTSKPIIITAGATFTTNVVGIEGKTNDRTIMGTGNAWQQIPLANNVIYGSVKVFVDNAEWRHVEFFTGWTPLKEFTVDYLDNYSAVIVFGNNESGLAPSKGSTIRITYRTGGGNHGNIISGAINQNISIHASGHLITCTATNYTKGEGGYNGDTIEDIRAKIPIYMKTQNRAVTGEDYKTICEGFASPTYGTIGKAAVSLRNHGCAGNIIDIYILARDGNIGLTKTNDAFKKELMEELHNKKMFSDYVCLRDGEIIMTDIFATLTLSRNNKPNEKIIKQKSYWRIMDLLSLNNFNFGQILKEGDIVKCLADIKEIENIDVSFTTERNIEEGHRNINIVSSKYYEIIRPDNITINIQYS